MMVFSEWWKTSRPARKPVLLMVVATIPYAVGFSTAYTVAQTDGTSIQTCLYGNILQVIDKGSVA